MIRATIEAQAEHGNSAHGEFDVTPWFEQASPREIKGLLKERNRGEWGGKTHVYYVGAYTDYVFEWMSYNQGNDAKLQELREWIMDNGATWNCEIDAEDVDRYFMNKKVMKVAGKAVTKLMKGFDVP